MKEQEIKNYIEEAHKNAVEKGFYDCPECKGTGWTADDGCPLCQGTGIDPNRNIGELLMLIVTELSEAVEAYRENSIFYTTSPKAKDFIYNMNDSFERGKFQFWIKDTFEDKIADVFIRLFDLCGYLKIEPGFSGIIVDKIENVPEHLFFINQYICGLYKRHIGLIENVRDNIKDILILLGTMCHQLKIDIDKHIELKMAYNKTRPKKHRKEY